MLRKLRAVRRFQRRLGIIRGARLAVLREANTRRLIAKPRITIRVPVLAHPVTLRTAPSSDFDVFSQVIVGPEYDFLDHLEGIRTIVDLGANVGLASARMLSKFPGCHVLAIEPDPGNCEMLRQNLAPYGNRVHILEGAAWISDGQVALDKSFGDCREWAVAVKSGNGVRAYSMEHILSRVGGSIDLLKIDIEGSERVIFSADTSWLSRVRNLSIELHGADCEKAFREGTHSYSWRESRCGEYTVCEGVMKKP